MALYDYKCGSCNFSFTRSQSIANRDKPTEGTCEQCGSKTIERLLSAPAIQMAGIHGLKIDGGLNDRFKDMKAKLPKSGHTQIDKYMK